MKNRNKYLNDTIVLLNKSRGISSFGAINKLKWILNAGKTGHAGTLDPMAEGLLIVMINKAAKFSENLMKKDKEYYVEMELGYETDSYDSEGQVTKRYEEEISLSEKEVKETVSSFLGDIEQIPPMFSAVKVNGEKLYNLARKGIEVERKPRKVSVHYINNINYNEEAKKISFTAGVSSGTYIRTLVSDIGGKLGVYGTMTRLIRTKVGDYGIEDSVKLEDIIQFFEKNQHREIDGTEIDCILKSKSVESVFSYESVFVSSEKYTKLKNGMTVLIDVSRLKNIKNLNIDKVYKVYNRDNKFLGTARILKIINNKVYLKRDKYFL